MCQAKNKANPRVGLKTSAKTYNVHRFVFEGVFVFVVLFRQWFVGRPPDFSLVFADFQEARLGFLESTNDDAAFCG